MAKISGLIKATAGIMKNDAMIDYNRVTVICNGLNLPVVQPKGKSVWDIEDATAEMIKSLPPTQKLELLKGLSYYLTLPTNIQKK